MGSFSIWHWLIVGSVLLAIFGGGWTMRTAPSSAGKSYMYSVTKNISAAMHLGRIAPQTVIDRLEDRHKARLPELGMDTTRLLSEAKVAKKRNLVFAFAFLVPAYGFLSGAFQYGLVEQGSLSPVAYASYFVMPLALATLLGFAKTLLVNRHIRKNLMPCADKADDLRGFNAVIFGGFFPFAGYGIDVEGWSFTIDTLKPKTEGAEPQPITQTDFLNFVFGALARNITEGCIEDKLFVNGLGIKNNKQFLAEPRGMPITRIDPADVAARLGFPEQTVRHYRLISIPLSFGHMHLTFFLRSTMLGSNLFIESHGYLLLPLRPEFTEIVDIPAKRGVWYHSRLLLYDLVVSPFSWLLSLWHLFAAAQRALQHLLRAVFGHPEDKIKSRTETYNYGNTSSLRESWASGSFQAYYEMQDREMAMKTCEHIIINAMVDYLDARGIATDDIKERRTQIFNSGVMVSGGTVNAQQMAVGTGANVKSKISKAVSSAKKR